MRPELCVSAVAVVDERILLVRRGRGAAQGQWSVPGGRVELGESLHEATVREVLEETALEVVVERELGWVERIDLDAEPPRHAVIIAFAVQPFDPDQPLQAGDDAAEACWRPLAELDVRTLAPGLADFLATTGILAV